MKVFIALPVYGGYDPHFTACMFKLLLQPPFSIQVGTCIGDSLVARARNKLAAEFLASDCTHLLFLDTDLIFSNEQLKALASHDVPVVAGFYPKKQRELAWVMNKLDGEEIRDGHLLRVKYAGTGCLMIRRDVLESMIQALPEMAYDGDDGDLHGTRWDFFATGPHTSKNGRRRYLSEDWFFCQRVLDMGIPIWMDTRVALKHVGQMIYPLDNPFEERELDGLEGVVMPECAKDDARLIFEGEYDMPLPRAPRTVLDIGANVGLFSLWAAKKWPDARIDAYEPWPENADDFEKNLSNFDNVTLFRKAAGMNREMRTMRAGRNRMCCSLLATEGEEISVPVEDADRLRSAEFIKIDTEGSEVDILVGLDLSSCLGIAVEAHTEKDAREIVDFLEACEFTIHSRKPTINGCSLIKAIRPVDAAA